MIFFATESLYSIERAFREMATREYKARPQTLHTTSHWKIMAWYGGEETILQISCCAVKSSMNSGHLSFLHAAHAYTFQVPPVTTVGDLAKATTMTSLNLLHMRSDTTFYFSGILPLLGVRSRTVDLMINNFPLALPTSVSFIVKVCEVKKKLNLIQNQLLILYKLSHEYFIHAPIKLCYAIPGASPLIWP